MNGHDYLLIAVVACIPLSVFVGRYELLKVENKQMKAWLRRDHDYKKSNPFPGYSREKDGKHSLRLYLFGFLRQPEVWSRPASMGGDSEFVRLREEQSYTALVRALSRCRWVEGEYPPEKAWQPFAMSFFVSLVASVGFVLAVRAIYYFSLLTWPYAPVLVGLLTFGLTFHLGGKWRLK